MSREDLMIVIGNDLSMRTVATANVQYRTAFFVVGNMYVF
jgi:hypothetical protein